MNFGGTWIKGIFTPVEHAFEICDQQYLLFFEAFLGEDDKMYENINYIPEMNVLNTYLEEQLLMILYSSYFDPTIYVSKENSQFIMVDNFIEINILDLVN